MTLHSAPRSSFSALFDSDDDDAVVVNAAAAAAAAAAVDSNSVSSLPAVNTASRHDSASAVAPSQATDATQISAAAHPSVIGDKNTHALPAPPPPPPAPAPASIKRAASIIDDCEALDCDQKASFLEQ